MKMKMNTKDENLTSKIELLQKEFTFLQIEVNQLKNSNANSTRLRGLLIGSGVVLELVLKCVYKIEGFEKDSKPSDKMLLEDLIQATQSKLPGGVLIHIRTIQSWRNFGGHSKGDVVIEVKQSEIDILYSALSEIVNWFLNEYIKIDSLKNPSVNKDPINNKSNKIANNRMNNKNRLMLFFGIGLISCFIAGYLINKNNQNKEIEKEWIIYCQKTNKNKLGKNITLEEWRILNSAQKESNLIVSDIDGNKYDIIAIGDYFWTKQNLNVSKFSNGDNIFNAQSNEDWVMASKQKIPAYCINKKGKQYGKLYNWYAVNDPRGLAPKGWSIPSAKNYTQLLNFRPDELKDSIGWSKAAIYINGNNDTYVSNQKSSNYTCFSALANGYRNYYCCPWQSEFNYSDDLASFWTSTPDEQEDAATSIDLGISGAILEPEISISEGSSRSTGMSIRIIKSN
jgi:uncharacterized protein (TIGR02145 family)